MQFPASNGSSLIQSVKVDNSRFTVRNVRQSSRFDTRLGTNVNDIRIGIISRDTLRQPASRTHPETERIGMNTATVTIPTSRLLNGVRISNIRTTRFNHMMNIISSYAEEILGVDTDDASIIFLGMVGRLPSTDPYGTTVQYGVLV